MPKVDHILVTGAGGLIGKKVVATLLEAGYWVTAIIRPNSIAPFKPHPRLNILWTDILNYDNYARKVKNITTIIHLAANKYHPKLSYLVNIQGAKNLIRLITERRLKDTRIINISSQSTKIRWMGVYGSSKKQSDQLIESSAAKWITIKPSLVYGQNTDGLFQTITKYIEKLPFVPVIGNGKWELFPITTNDLAQAILKIVRRPQTIGQVYDFGCQTKITFDDLIKLIEQELKIKKPIIHIPFLIGLVGVYLLNRVCKNYAISIDNVLGSNQNTNCNPKPIIKDLKIHPTSITRGIKQYFQEKPRSGLKIVIVGFGKMGILHSTILNTIEEVGKITLIDKNPQLINTAQSMGIKANFFASLNQALKYDNYDAVYICTPTFNHKEIIDTCYHYNIPYFVEKPVFNNFTDYKEILNPKFSNINKLCATGYFWLYRREIQYTKKILDQGIIGKVIDYKINLKHSEVLRPKNGWLFKKKLSGGGVLMNPCPHAFSLIQYFFGNPVVKQTTLKNLYNKGVEDEANVSLLHKNNIKGNLIASWSIPNYPILTIEYIIRGQTGSIKFINNSLIKNCHRKTSFLNYYQIPFNYPVYNLNPKSAGDAYYLEDINFIKNLKQKRFIINNLDFAYKVESIINECYEKVS